MTLDNRMKLVCKVWQLAWNGKSQEWSVAVHTEGGPHDDSLPTYYVSVIEDDGCTCDSCDQWEVTSHTFIIESERQKYLYKERGLAEKALYEKLKDKEIQSVSWKDEVTLTFRLEENRFSAMET